MDDWLDFAIDAGSDAADSAVSDLADAAASASDQIEYIDASAPLPDGFEYVDQGAAPMDDFADVQDTFTQDPTAEDISTSPQASGTDYSGDTSAFQQAPADQVNTYLPGTQQDTLSGFLGSTSKFATNLLNSSSAQQLVANRQLTQARLINQRGNGFLSGLFGNHKTGGTSSGTALAVLGIGAIAFAVFAK